MKITDKELREKIIEEIGVSTETDLVLSEGTELYDDMGLSSMEAYVLLNDLEEAFGVRIHAAALRHVRTVGDLCDLVYGSMSGRK